MKKIVLIFAVIVFASISTYDLYSYWEKINNGLTNTRDGKNTYIFITDLLVYNNSIYATTSNDGIFISTDNGENWVKKNNGIQGENIPYTLLAYNNNYIFASVKKLYSIYRDTLTGEYKNDSSGISGIYYSKDGGENWISTKRNGLTDSNYISAIAADDNILIVGTDNMQGVYISTDNGENWVQKKNGFHSNISRIYSLIIKDNIIFAGTSGGVYVSTDYGENWVKKSSHFISQIHFKGDTLISCSWNVGVNISYDKGETWIPKNNGLREKTVTCVATVNDLIFIGISPTMVWDPEGGVHYSSDGGDTWLTRNKGFRKTGISKIAIKDDYIFAAQTFGIADTNFGMYRAKLNEIITGVEFVSLREEHFYSAPPQPNPASELVRAGIYWDSQDYDIDNAEKGVYDILGNKVSESKDLQLTNIHPYSAEIIWNCSSASSGLYFIVLNYKGKMRTIPVIVTK